MEEETLYEYTKMVIRGTSVDQKTVQKDIGIFCLANDTELIVPICQSHKLAYLNLSLTLQGRSFHNQHFTQKKTKL